MTNLINEDFKKSVIETDINKINHIKTLTKLS